MTRVADQEIERYYRDIWDSYRARIDRYCRYQLQDQPEAAEDCCQNTFLALYAALQDGETIACPGAWLYKTAQQQVFACRRQQKRRQARIVPLETAETDPSTRDAEDPDMLEEILYRHCDEEAVLRQVTKALTPAEQALLRAAYGEQRGTEALAQALGIDENAVYQRKWRLRQKVRRLVQQAVADIEDALVTRK